jgi:hypothetical protein
MQFERTASPLLAGIETYIARCGKWNFLIIKDTGKWTASYRLHDPKTTVSASSTIMGPFDEFDDAVGASEAKWQELRRLA